MNRALEASDLAILNAGLLGNNRELYQRESRKNNRFSKQNNNFARAALFCSFQFVTTTRLRRENAEFQVLWRTQTHHVEFLLLVNLGSASKNSIPGKFT